MEKRPTVSNDSILLFDISNKTPEDIELSVNMANEFVDNLKTGLENLNALDRTSQLFRFMHRIRGTSGEGVGDTEDIVSSIEGLYYESIMDVNQEDRPKEDIEDNLERNKEFEDRMNQNVKEIYSELWREAIQFERADKFKGAIIKYREIIDKFPESYSAYYRLAVKLVDRTAENQ